MQEIVITVPLDGDVTIEVNGVKGGGCKELTKNIEKALGTVVSDKPTKEMHEKPSKQGINQY
jgi:hypothetical protein